MFFIDKIRSKFLSDKGVGVLKPDPKDERDFKVGFLGYGDYEPKHDRKLLDTISVRDQYPFNTCVFESCTVQKERQENEKLSVRSVVNWAKDQGYISGNGWSTLRAGQKAIQKFGALPYGLIEEGNRSSWRNFSEVNLDDRQKQLASENKSKTYWRVENVDEIYEALDKGDVVQTAFYWRTAFNMSGGLKNPWILNPNQGYRVGAHAVLIVGYDRNYRGRDVFICQNSYGEDYGDDGKFYLTKKHLREQLNIFGGWVMKDIDIDIGKVVSKYDKMNVRAHGGEKIYRIESGKKRHYSSWEAFVKKSKGKGWQNISQDKLDKVPEGESISVNN